METSTAVGIIVPAMVAIGIFISGLVVYSSRRNRELIDKLRLDVQQLQTQISPFWASLQSKIVDALHHPGPEHKELDDLLEKLQALTLTAEEKILLKNTLEQLVSNAPVDAAKKASMLLEIMPMVEKEEAGKIPPTDQRTMEQKKEAERVNGGTPA